MLRFDLTHPLSLSLSLTHTHIHSSRVGAADSAGHGCYYESGVTKALDDKLGDCWLAIIDAEAGILRSLRAKVLEAAGSIAAARRAAAEADVLVALARAAREFDLVRPLVVDAPVLDISRGRHFLAERIVDSFVPNDTRMGAADGRVNIITGPNCSGKSVYIKQGARRHHAGSLFLFFLNSPLLSFRPVALIVYLAHLGSFVPAQAATVGLVDRIFARLPCPEAAACPLRASTFVRDTRQVASAARHATAKSLIIIDEARFTLRSFPFPSPVFLPSHPPPPFFFPSECQYGKGTRALDSVALLAALVRSLASRGASAPRTLLTTHFDSLLRGGLLPRVPCIALQTMAVLTQAPAQPPPQQQQQPNNAQPQPQPLPPPPQQPAPPPRGNVVFLFKLVPGEAAGSYGAHCAELGGVPRSVVDRARSVLAAKRAKTPLGVPTGEAGAWFDSRTAACVDLVQRFIDLHDAANEASGGKGVEHPRALLHALFGEDTGGNGEEGAAGEGGGQPDEGLPTAEGGGGGDDGDDPAPTEAQEEALPLEAEGA